MFGMEHGRLRSHALGCPPIHLSSSTTCGARARAANASLHANECRHDAYSIDLCSPSGPFLSWLFVRLT
jgi:hypothetical protein